MLSAEQQIPAKILYVCSLNFDSVNESRFRMNPVSPVTRAGLAAVLLGTAVVVSACFDSVEPNVPPLAFIVSPTDGQAFGPGETVEFLGSGSDLEDGTLTGSPLSWKSSLDGSIGTGTRRCTTSV